MRQCTCAKIAILLTKLEFPIMIHKARGKGKAVFCAPWRRVRSGGTAPLVLNLDTRWICADNCHLILRTESMIPTEWEVWWAGVHRYVLETRKIPYHCRESNQDFSGVQQVTLWIPNVLSRLQVFTLSHVYETMFLTVKQRAAAMLISILKYSAQYRRVSEKSLNVFRSAMPSNILPSVDELYTGRFRRNLQYYEKW